MEIYDSLKSVYNISYFQKTLGRFIGSLSQVDTNLYILLIEVDGFKVRNDDYDKDSIEKLIIGIAKKLKTIVSPKETVSRLGGAEFTVFIKRERKKDVIRLVEHIIRDINKPFDIEGNKEFLTASVGIYRVNCYMQTIDDMIKNAKYALACSKNKGSGTYTFYEDNIEMEEIHLQSPTALSIEKALENNEFEIFYQPMFDTSNGRVVGAEALLRWHCKRKFERWIPPSEFIPVAEESRLIIPLGNWVFKQVCLQIVEWKARKLAPTKVSINISAIQLQDKWFLDYVKETLRETHVDASSIEFEITESALINDFEFSNNVLRNLRSMGIKISLDDFGVGYSSFGYLKDLCVDSLKLDRLFITDICKEERNYALVKSIIDIARILDLQVTGEGVENRMQFLKLKEANCDFVQGFLFSKPINKEQYETFLVDKGHCDSIGS